MNNIRLTTKQEEGLKLAIQRYKSREPYTCIAGYAGTGKAQPMDTLIPTPNGYKRLGDIQVGDYVFDRLGNPTKVLGVYPQGELEVFKVVLKDGRSTLCNDNHLWSYYSQHGNLMTTSTKFLKSRGLTYPNGTFKTKIPRNKAVHYKTQEYMIDPYVVGAFLGDGCCTNKHLTFSSSDEEMVAEIAKLLDLSYKRKNENEYTWYFYFKESKEYISNNRTYIQNYVKTKDVFDNIKDDIIQLSSKKRIPQIYKYGSIEQRLSLLQGLLDTDGCICCADNHFTIRYSSISSELVADVKEVVLSLGYGCYVIKDKRNTKYSTGTCDTLYITMPNTEKEKVFRLSRKKNIAKQAKEFDSRTLWDRIPIVAIEDMGYKTHMVCIKVDNEEELYLTNDYIVTHNTTLVNHIVNELKIPDKYIAYCAYTAKASLVLQQKGCPGATTAHRLLYYSKELTDGTFIHTPREYPERPLKLIIVDEVSMLEKEQWEILMKWRIPVIALGDPFQLPPIHEDNGVLAHPHIFLDQVMRQAQDSEIIRLSMDIREGKSLSCYNGKDVCVTSKSKISDQLLLKADQVLCGKNVTRFDLNQRMRRAIWGDKYQIAPIKGDKIICLKNYWNYGNLTNGTIGTIGNMIIKDGKLLKPVMIANFKSDIGDKYTLLNMDYKIFTEGKTTVNQDNWREFHRDIRPMEFDYGYAITVHKSQGSEFDKVILFNEYLGSDREHYLRWLYTGVTRASKKLIVGI